MTYVNHYMEKLTYPLGYNTTWKNRYTPWGISPHGKTDMPHESWGISILNCNFDFILIKTPIILTLDFNYFSPLLGIMEYIFYETRGTLPGAPSLLSSTAI